MKRSGILLVCIVMLGVLLFSSPDAFAVTDGYYHLSEVSQPAWEGTDASRTKAPSVDYDYAYGDESSLIYTLPWAFTFYDQPYSQLTADTNGNLWFTATGAAHSFDLATTGRGPVITAWNNDLSSYFYGGVFIQHKTNPERVVVEWQAESYSDEGTGRVNNFAVVLFPNGTIRTDYRTLTPALDHDSGSGISGAQEWCQGYTFHKLSLASISATIFLRSGSFFNSTANRPLDCDTADSFTPKCSPISFSFAPLYL